MVAIKTDSAATIRVVPAAATAVLEADSPILRRMQPPPARKLTPDDPMVKIYSEEQLYCVIGLDTGDEAKGKKGLDTGKQVQEVRKRPTAVGMMVKVNGGANSGHTVDRLKCNVIPAGARDETIKYLGISRGVVMDPLKLYAEMKYNESQEIRLDDKRLKVDYKVMLSDISDRIVDLARETYRSRTDGPLGSTGRGIALAYEHEIAHDQIYYQMFQEEGNEEAFHSRMKERLRMAQVLCQHGYGLTAEEFRGLFEILSKREIASNQEAIKAGLITEEELSFTKFIGTDDFSFNTESVCSTYWEAGRRFCVDSKTGKKLDYIVDLGLLAQKEMADGNAVIGEFGQGYYLSVRQGFRRGSTSSHTTPAEIYNALNIPPSRYPLVALGNAKFYTTKVGEAHYVPTHLDPRDTLWFKLAPMELGVVTRRQRGVGHADAASIGKAIAHAGCDILFLNKLDPLTHGPFEHREPIGGFATIVREFNWQGNLKICVGYYEPGNNKFFRAPPEDEILWERLHPVYLEVPGWSKNIDGMTSWNDLPLEAKNFVALYYTAIIEAARAEGLDENTFPIVGDIGTGPLPGQGIKDAPLGKALYEYGKTIYDAMMVEVLPQRPWHPELTRSDEALIFLEPPAYDEDDGGEADYGQPGA